ncbi:YheT family hydrolase [Jeongeupia naejangsanensis]|uniref:Alpha/beta fold hydrolase n=1 Tax=Jeongeupia naejangsanensis TaxID=613195 RepID=A0ABS2BJ55_9NEIS|nr:alpha/beta fold hydrolase [Jeongeupia naejangsanensis]MBM3115133.1 alpha/beta fold hydrolase [Jeongeupia naejangsanensis]
MQRERQLQLPVYRAPRWLPGGHAQTIYPATLLWQRTPAYRRETWVTPDLDSIAVDWVDGRAGTPILVLFHGLEGGSRSHYALSLFQHFYPKGWRCVVPHFRSCGNVTNRLPRAYHAGDANEIDWVLRRIRNRNPDAPLYAVGVSLGGNALLKWLGEQGEAAGEVVASAASVCAPLDLMICGAALDTGVNRRIYTRNFLRTLKRKMLAKLQITENPFVDVDKVRAAETLREFDDLVTAPLHGYNGVDDYWTRASSKPGLTGICVPTLVINARNDPFVPVSALPGEDDVSPWVTLLQPEEGGHVGFLSGPPPGRLNWLPNTLLRYFQFHAPDAR